MRAVGVAAVEVEVEGDGDEEEECKGCTSCELEQPAAHVQQVQDGRNTALYGLDRLAHLSVDAEAR